MSESIGAEVFHAHHLVLLFARWTLARESSLATLTLSHTFLSVLSCAFLSVLRSDSSLRQVHLPRPLMAFGGHAACDMSIECLGVGQTYRLLSAVCFVSSLPACMEGKTYRAACQHMLSHATDFERPIAASGELTLR